jgi:hypothetical protein
MAEVDNQSQQDPLTSLIIEFGVRLNELEEKQRLLRDRTLLVGENLISIKTDHSKENLDIKKQLNKIEQEIKDLKHTNRRIINEMGNFSRKAEVEILQRQFKMFEPLEFARIKDVKEIVKHEILNLKDKKMIKEIIEDEDKKHKKEKKDSIENKL